MTQIRIGTRASALAMTQTKLIAAELEKRGQSIALVPISTIGDRSGASIGEMGSVGVFTSALREALLADEIDVAVHSYKDLPTAPQPGLTLGAVPLREDHHDVLVSRSGTLAQLPPDAVIGTGAPRRIAQLAAARPDVKCIPIRGNVDSRLRRVSEGELNAVVLARAGLNRLDVTLHEDQIGETLSTDIMLPAPAQGALAIECRDDDAVLAVLREIDDPNTRACVAAERTLLGTLEAGCTAPVGAYAEVCDVFGGQHVHLYGGAFALDGKATIRRTNTATLAEAATLGRTLAEELLAAGAGAIIAPPADGATGNNEGENS